MTDNTTAGIHQSIGKWEAVGGMSSNVHKASYES